jgi:cellulose synthase/poly-beta-1,6-N-acetylglucosamine synthase-like glycosyltransferase
MKEARGDLVVCCDATNVLPPEFVSKMLPWFDDPKVAATYGRIEDPHPAGALGRWRARHLFKGGHEMQVTQKAQLITYGTIVRRSAVLQVGNYDARLRHSEDAELGTRLLAAGYDIVCDPRVSVFCNIQNSLPEVLERYWRWYAGHDCPVSWSGYARDVVYSLKGMAVQDLKKGDLGAAIISLICPHYRFWRTLFLRLRRPWEPG